MAQRFVSIWFRYLTTDWFTIKQPQLAAIPFVLAAPVRGRKVITAANSLAEKQGIGAGMVVADARALVPGLKVLDDMAGLHLRLLKAIGEWCIRYTPVTAVDGPDGLLLNVTGCAHLWGGEAEYLNDITNKLKSKGYQVQAAMADTMGCAWAVARFGKTTYIIAPAGQLQALLGLPPEALRLEAPTLQKLHKLGLYTINSFIHMPRPVLRRRFGEHMLLRIAHALGTTEELAEPLAPPTPYQERLPCLEPIMTATGIEIALQRLLDMLCGRLQKEGKGIRSAIFKGYRMDGKVEQIPIGTNRATHSVKHLFKLFEINIHTIEPALGIELFVLEATKVEPIVVLQEAMWAPTTGLEDNGVAELLDRITNKLGSGVFKRYLPDEHYWPERSFKQATTLQEKPAIEWKTDRPRPIYLLPQPELVEVAAPVPDYPPLHFRHKGRLHKITKADGPERIEREWWMDAGQHRDYYQVEDEEGNRYWLYRLGHYENNIKPLWFIHGYFA
jgi:protein ImuB